MASRQSVSSILKPPKVRAPLKEIEPVDQDAEENTATSLKRKVSFSGMNKIKMYNTCATSLTVNQAPMFDEKISISSDSLNGDKTKLSGKFEKSDGQITFESTDCTNVEDNGRVIIEYESPSDNMEMTEAKVGKLYDSMFLIDNYDSEHINNSLDNSETNMEFTEAIKVGQIITVDLESDFSSTELSETLNSEDEKQLSDKSYALVNHGSPKTIFNKSSNSSSMEFTCANTKPNYVGTDISNLESTYMTTKSQKLASSNENYKSFSMELTQVPDRLISEDCSKLIYESSIEYETSFESKNNSKCELETEPNLFYTKIPEINNHSNHETIVCTLKGFDDCDDNVERLSLSMVSMDIDPTLEFNEYEKNDIVVTNSELVENEQDSSGSVEIPREIENITPFIDNALDNSNKTNINHQNSESKVSMIPTSSSFVQEMSSEKNVYEYSIAEKPLIAHTSIFDQNQFLHSIIDKSVVLEENQQRKYSRKTMVHTAPLNVEIDLNKFVENIDMSIGTEESQQNISSIVPTSDLNQTQSNKNEDLSDKSTIDEEVQPKLCSRKSIAHASIFNQSHTYENQDLSDKCNDEVNHQKNYSRKTITPTSVFDQSQFDENNDLSNITSLSDDTEEENHQKNYSRKSNASSYVFNQSVSYEIKDLSDKSTTDEENRPKIYSRKSVAPTNMINEIKTFYENEDISDTPIVVEDNQKKMCSRKSITPISDFNQSHSFKNQDLSDKSTSDEENQQKIYSRKSVVPINEVNEMKSIYENEDISDTPIVVEDNQQNMCSRKSIAPSSVFNQSQPYDNKDLSNFSSVSDESGLEEENYQKNYSRKSNDPTYAINQSMSCEIKDISDKSTTHEENQPKLYSRKSVVATVMVNDVKSFYENEDISDTPIMDEDNKQNMLSRKSIAPTSVFNQSRSYENQNLSDKCIIDEVNQQKNYSRKTITPTSAFDQSNSYENMDLSNITPVDENNQQKTHSRKSIVTSTFNKSILDTTEKLIESGPKRCSMESIDPIPVLDQFCSQENDVSYASATVEENIQKRYSRKSIGPTSFFNEVLEGNMSDNLSLNVESNVSYVSSSNEVNQLDISKHYEEYITKKIENLPAMLNVNNDDDLNSPFRKKSRKSIVIPNLTNQPVEQTLILKNDTDNLLKTTDENFEYESKMDISMEYESKIDDVENITSQKTNTSENILHENKEIIVASNKLIKNETGLNELAENHKIIIEGDEIYEDKTNKSTKIIDDVNKSNNVLNSKDISFSHDIDMVSNAICNEDISNMSITDEKYQCIEKSEDSSFIGNRKRSYSNRDCVPLSCSTFVSKSSVENCINKDFNKEEFLKESPIKTTNVEEKKMNDSVIGYMIEEDHVKEESFKENLNNEVLEFLARWNEQFIEKQLSLDKCTNKEWVFNVLDSNIILTISYLPISNDLSFLKVANISFTTKITPQNEIIKFGVNWILSKYNPKVYKQICYTSRDVELLLRCLLEDVQFISKMMNNMTYVRDVYCVEFIDNKAQFVLHNMNCPLMVRIDVLLSNIHKLSVKDINVDCLFGLFNIKLLDEVVENINKDFNILQSLIEKLKNCVL